MKHTTLALLTASMLMLGACGEDGDTTAKNAIADSLMEKQSQGQMVTLERAEAECIADGMVDEIGTDQLQEYGLLNEDGTTAKDPAQVELSTKDAKATTDAIFGCTDVMRMLQRSIMKEMGDQNPGARSCVKDAMTEDVVRKMFVAQFTGNTGKASQRLVQPMMRCLAGTAGLPRK